MRVALRLDTSLAENAASFYDRAKRARKKMAGVDTAIRMANRRLEEAPRKVVVAHSRPKPAWYEKYHWCFSSNGFLLIGGKDASTNEEVVKKHAVAGDLVLHTDMAGSPFVIIKAEGREIPELTIAEAAELVAAFSRAWKKGMSLIEVLYVKPEQVTKEANAGESLGKGAFVIRGKTTYVSAKMTYAVGLLEDGRVMGGSPRAVKKHCLKFVMIRPGNAKTSDIAKEVRKRIGGDLDEIVRCLPAGCEIAK